MLAANERLARRVGVLTLVVVALAVVFFVGIAPRIEWRAKHRVVVTFRAAGGLREGAPFVVAGQPVGSVERIALGGDGVRVTVALASDHALRHGGDIFVTSRGVVSERYLEIGPSPTDAPLLRDGDVVAGIDPPTLDVVLQRSWANLVAASAFADAIAPEARALRTELAALRATVAALPPLRVPLIASAGTSDVARLRTLGDDAARTLIQARATIAKLRTGALALRASIPDLRGLAHEVDTAIDRTREALADADALLDEAGALQAMLANQEGSLMRILHDPELPEDTKDIGKILKRSPWRVIARPAE